MISYSRRGRGREEARLDDLKVQGQNWTTGLVASVRYDLYKVIPPSLRPIISLPLIFSFCHLREGSHHVVLD